VGIGVNVGVSVGCKVGNEVGVEAGMSVDVVTDETWLVPHALIINGKITSADQGSIIFFICNPFGLLGGVPDSSLNTLQSAAQSSNLKQITITGSQVIVPTIYPKKFSK
jgi:hypothetical protein